MSSTKEVGVVTEQGFVAGNGLGFNPLSEADKEKVKEEDLKPKTDSKK